MERRSTDYSLLFGFLLGGGTFILASYVLHCGFGMGPWPCQKDDQCRR